MKHKIWKALGIAALAMAIPFRVKKDEESGKKKYQSLLLSVDVGPGENGEGTSIDVNIGEGILNGPVAKAVAAKKEAKLFADDDPEAAVVDVEIEDAPEETEEGLSETVPDAEGVSAAEESAAETDQDPLESADPEVTEDDFYF